MIYLLLFLSLFLFESSIEAKQNCYVTIETIPDGFGSQYQSLLSAIAIADYLGVEFVYTPVQGIAHNYSNDRKFAQKLIDFTGIRSFYKDVRVAAGLTKKNVSVLSQIGKKSGILYVINSSKIIVDNDTNILLRAKGLLRKIYFSTSKPNLKSFDEGLFNVAVHVRRKNIVDDRESLLPDAYYFKVMDSIVEKHPNALFHIYSQQNKDVCDIESIYNTSLDVYKKYNCIFHLDEPVEETFHGMVMADALVTCDSSLSYVAAILSEGEIYYHKFWHKPLPSWIIREEYVADF